MVYFLTIILGIFEPFVWIWRFTVSKNGRYIFRQFRVNLADSISVAYSSKCFSTRRNQQSISGCLRIYSFGMEGCKYYYTMKYVWFPYRLLDSQVSRVIIQDHFNPPNRILRATISESESQLESMILFSIDYALEHYL